MNLKASSKDKTVMPVLQTEYEGSAETVRTDATEGAESAEVTAKEARTEPVANTQSEPQAVSIDTSKYGRSGKAALKKWSQNEYINARSYKT